MSLIKKIRTASESEVVEWRDNPALQGRKTFLPCEWAAKYDQQFPRIDLSFLGWRHKESIQVVTRVSRKVGPWWHPKYITEEQVARSVPLPRFAVFSVRHPFCCLSGWRGAMLGDAPSRHDLPGRERWLTEHYQDTIDKLTDTEVLHTRFSGAMPPKLAKAVMRVARDERISAYIIAETGVKDWTLAEPVETRGDPLAVIRSADGIAWLVGWYDLTAGEDYVVGTHTFREGSPPVGA